MPQATWAQVPDASGPRMAHEALPEAVNIYPAARLAFVPPETREDKLALSWLSASTTLLASVEVGTNHAVRTRDAAM